MASPAYEPDHESHPHHFGGVHPENERRTFIVVVLTLVTMVAEIVAGVLTGSMALLSDGLHMGTHAGALGISLFAYVYSRRQQDKKRYTFGTGKVGVLAAFANAVLLGMMGVLIFYESGARFLNPVEIHFDTAILVAAIGLAVNLVCAWILGGEGHSHSHEHEDHEHDHDHEHPRKDYNQKAAFMHVVADALTSVFAIVALVVGKYYGLVQFDPLAGFLGGAMILWWAWGLLRQTSRILVDSNVSERMLDAIRRVMEADADNRVLDLHAWNVSENDVAVIVVLLTSQPRPPEYYRSLLAGPEFAALRHVNVEVHSPDEMEKEI